MAKGQAQLPPPLDELPPPDPQNAARQKALASALGGGANPPAVEGGGDGPDPLPAPLPAAAQSQPAASPAAQSSDPFTAMGGGVQLPNGDWVPRDHPAAAGIGQAPAAPAAAAPGPAAPAAAAPAAGADSTDPFADMGGGVKLANGDWVPRDHPSAAGAPGNSAPGGLGPPSAAATPIGAGGGQATDNTVQGAYKNALENLLEGKTPQEAGKDAGNSAAVHAYRTQRQHQEGKDRALLAERNAAGGFSGSGGAETGVLGLRQAASRDIGQYAGQQAQVAEAGRRQELLAAIATSQAMGDSNAARALQRELAMLGHSEFEDQLDFNAQDRQAYYNQRALEMLFGGSGGAGVEG